MGRIRVFVVGDSVVARKILCVALSTDSEIEIAGSAADGNIAWAKSATLKPDVVTSDIEMPVMSGIETSAAVRAEREDPLGPGQDAVPKPINCPRRFADQP